MNERNVKEPDLDNAIFSATGSRARYADRWMIEGVDQEGDSLTVVVQIQDNLLIKTLGLRASDLGDLLDVTPETVSRWETDKTPIDRRAFGLLSVMILEKKEGRSSVRDTLEALKSPLELPDCIALELTDSELHTDKRKG